MRSAPLEDALKTALRQGLVTLHYQPQIDLATGQVVGLEALARISETSLEEVSPEIFIPLAQEMGLMTDIGHATLTQLKQDLPVWIDRYPSIRIGINFSMQELVHPTFFSRFHAWLKDMPINASQHIDIEVTEAAFNHVPPEVVQGLNSLRTLGVRVAIDDFGAGQSSLARLHTLPFDIIKLDKQFIHQINHPIVYEIVKAVIHLAKQFDKVLVAEGVETQAQHQTLKDMGCPIAQGFLFGKAVPL